MPGRAATSPAIAQQSDKRSPRAPSVSLVCLCVLFMGAGIMHFVRPDGFVRITPDWVPAPLLMVYVSGVAEIMGGVGLLKAATRVVAGWGLIALLVAVFPANIHMLQLARSEGAASWYIAALWIRLPLQPLLVWWVWRSAIRSASRQ